MAIRITYDPIRYRDQYSVTRKGNNIRVTRVAGGNDTFYWIPETDGYIVRGFPVYSGATRRDVEMNKLSMIVSAIDSARGIEPAGMAYEIYDTYAENRTANREYIEENINNIVEE